MTSILAALILSIVPQDDGICRDFVDLVELNHFYDEKGELVFDQLIWYDWSDRDGRFQARAWRLVRNHAAMPIRQWFGKFDGRHVWVSSWADGEAYRCVMAKSFTESWTQWDVELLEREHLPKEKRRELSKSPKSRTRF